MLTTLTTKLGFLIQLASLGTFAVLLGCEHTREPSRMRTGDLIAMLGSDDRAAYEHACDELFDRSLAAVLDLLDAADDRELVHFTAPTFPYRSLRPERVTRGQVCLYLVEAIRCGRLAHSRHEGFACGPDAAQEQHCAQAEYRRWFDSVQKGSAEYEPKVRWASVDEAARASFVEQFGKEPAPEYLSVVRLDRR